VRSALELPAGRAARPAGSRVSRAGSRARSYLALFALVAASRVASTIHYVEDTDSLRFALAVRDYSVAELRPHFPGYPVFVVLAKGLAALTGSYAIAFSLLGAVAVFGIIYYLQQLLRVGPGEPLGVLVALLVFFNPLIWLLSNRYMPDLLGAACALAALHHLLGGRREVGFVLAGLLAGVRLSYLPFLLPPVLAALRRDGLRGAAFGALGVLVWLVPLVLDTGWGELVAAAQKQTEGHFVDFGGTVYTEPDLMGRAAGLLEGLVAHGLGSYWSLRHPLTLLVTGGLLATLAAGVRPLRDAFPRSVVWMLVASWPVYLVWIFLYQNVIYKSRHVLPLLPLLLLVAALGAQALLRRGRTGQIVVGLFLAAYAAVTLVLVQQHRRPTAIAQVAEHLRGRTELHVVSIPLVNFYLSSLGVQARFTSAEGGEPVVASARPPGGRIVTVGIAPPWKEPPVSERTFYHNPYVNRMWPAIVVREYRSDAE
jgi:hypothetical protein